MTEKMAEWNVVVVVDYVREDTPHGAMFLFTRMMQNIPRVI